jgi:hypothetical protein
VSSDCVPVETDWLHELCLPIYEGKVNIHMVVKSAGILPSLVSDKFLIRISPCKAWCLNLGFSVIMLMRL